MLLLDDCAILVAARLVLLESDLCSLWDNSSITCNTASTKTSFSVYEDVGAGGSPSLRSDH